MDIQTDSVVMALGSKADDSLPEFLLESGCHLYSFYSVGEGAKFKHPSLSNYLHLF